ncbi:MAG: SGNH/GDSL hydrolase family protein [Deltaproteobacteria bacterium]|nr:MAG: SGNH/GDSL hydrolase family protein [Deltaproteobacteria bacterium]
MRTLRTIGAAAASLCLAGAAGSADFSDVFFFGDSLSDTGNFCTGLELFGYAPRRCSNGDVWVDGLAAALGFEATPSIELGNNFANGGAETTDLDLQINLFCLAQGILVPCEADPGALYVIWLGGNDVLGGPDDPQAMVGSVENVLDGIERLRSYGARQFLVPNLPDIGRAYGSFEVPIDTNDRFTPAERDLTTARSLAFNAALETGLASLRGVQIHSLDVFALFEEVIADPEAFGFVPGAIDRVSDDTDFAFPCLLDPDCAADPDGPVADGFALFDAIHPTAALHAWIADRAVTLVPEPAPGALHATGLAVVLALHGLAVRGSGRRRARRGRARASV